MDEMTMLYADASGRRSSHPCRLHSSMYSNICRMCLSDAMSPDLSQLDMTLLKQLVSSPADTMPCSICKRCRLSQLACGRHGHGAHRQLVTVMPMFMLQVGLM